MRYAFRSFHAFSRLGLALLVGGLLAQPAWAAKAGKGYDLKIGGPGEKPGLFAELCDVTFDPSGKLYTLEGIRTNLKTRQQTGNRRVQIFDREGKKLGLIDLHDAPPREALGKLNDPQRIAADAAGNVYVTQPAGGKVEQFAANGEWVRSYDVPRTMAVCVVKIGGQERIAVVPSRREAVRGEGQKWLGGDEVVILSPTGGIESSIKLEKVIEDVSDVTADHEGNFYIQGEPRAIYKFSQTGKLLHTFGGNRSKKAVGDGSELLHTVAVDSKGAVYTMTYGNPASLVRFDADGKTVSQRPGQFAFANPWSSGNYTILSIDPDDRLWVGAAREVKPESKDFAKAIVPTVLRVEEDFFNQQTRTTNTYALGFDARLTCDLPFHVAYDPNQPIPMRLTVASADRAFDAVKIEWRALDPDKIVLDQGSFDMKLENGKEAQAAFTFTPRRYASCFVLARAVSAEGDVGAVSALVGVTPRYDHLPGLDESDTKGGWADSPRQMWAGLLNMRIHPSLKNMETTDAEIALAEKYGVTWFVQLAGVMKELKPEVVREVATRYKGRVKVYEICNEPNFTSGPKGYVEGHKMAYNIIKEIDPHAQVMGPALVHVDLDWLRKAYEFGLKDVTDILSFHDYEGHDNIDPVHWAWKFGEVRKIMAENGDSAKPVWQTERAIGAYAAGQFQGRVQAIRLSLHHDLLQTLGISSEHNNQYYLNEAGYTQVPTYAWSKFGPHPAALAMRTRYALTAAIGRRYAGQLDFGPSGNPYLMGLRYSGDDGETVILRNLGTRDMPVDFTVQGAGNLHLIDSWGNTSQAAVDGGRTRLALGQMPVYVQLPPKVALAAPRFDYGKNLAPQATFTYTAPTVKGDLTLLNNGIIETHNSENPDGGTDGAKIWQGELPEDSQTKPQILEMAFPAPQRVGTVIVRGVRATNAFSYPLDYDLQYQDGDRWVTIETINRHMPLSESGRTVHPTAKGVGWIDDTNFFIHRFAPITAVRLRMVVRAATRGATPDLSLVGPGSKIPPQRFMLREVEVYGPGDASTSAN